MYINFTDPWFLGWQWTLLFLHIWRCKTKFFKNQSSVFITAQINFSFIQL